MIGFSIQKQKTPGVFKTLPLWDLLIIGAGPAGMNAALYAQRKGLHVGMVTKEIGGQLHNTSTVDNYLGLSMLEGKDLSAAFLKHIQALEVPIYTDVWVQDIQKLGMDFVITLSDGVTLKSKTLLYATGGKPRQLGIPGEDTFANKGVSYCTTCDAPFFKGKHVIVAGGGNSAAEAVIDLAPFASHITVIHRSQWRADPITLKKHASIQNLTVHLETQLLEVIGQDVMRGVKILDKKTKQIKPIAADGLFVEIGLIPTSDGIKHLAHLNDRQEVVIDDHFMTNVPGLFAAGDVSNVPFKQIVIAVGDGAKAALSIQQYLIHQYSKGE